MSRPFAAAVRCIMVDRPAHTGVKLHPSLHLGVFVLGTTSRGDHIRMVLVRPGMVFRRVGQALLLPLLLALLAGAPLWYLHRDAIHTAVIATYNRSTVHSPSSIAETPRARTKQVLAATVNLYQEPAPHAAVVTVLQRDAVVVLLNDVVSSRDTVWVFVSDGHNHRGWVSATQLH